jgi:GH24 family phage-related lysozyme (muramidase)
MGVKGAAMREMPGLTALAGLHREVKGRAEKLSDASAIDASVKEQRTNNIISIEMVRQLRSINNNVLQQTRISALQANNAKQAAMFAEENDREKSQRDKELLDAIKSLKGGAGTSGVLGAGGAGAGGKGFLGSILDAIQNASLLESALGALGLYAGGKTIFGGGGKTPTPSTGGGGGGMMRGGGALAARGLLRFIPYVSYALLAAEVGYEAYKIFGNQGGQGPKPPKPGTGGGVSTTPIVEGSGGAAFGMYAKPGVTAKGSYNAARDSQAANVNQPAQKIVRGIYGVGDPTRRSTVGAVGEDATKFITGKEGFVGKATKDTNRMAIGYGHNITDAEIKSGKIDLGNGEFINVSGASGKDTTITKEQADKLFSKDLGRYESIVIRAIGQEAYNKLSQNQKTAILSYVYNVGSVPKGFADAIKTGNYANAAASIRNGVATASGEKDPERRKQLEASLKIRRKKEGDLFDTAGPATSESRMASRSSTGVLTNTSGPASRSITPVSGLANEMETQNSIYSPNSTSGSTPRSSVIGPIQVTDKQANSILAQQLKVTKAVARATVIPGGKSATERLKETRREENKDQKYIRTANQSFLNQFQNTTQRLLSKAIYDTVVVGAYGKQGSRNLVSKQEASGEGFRGKQIADITKLNTRTQKILTNVFGKEIGRSYAPMISQLGTAYLEVGARQVGRGLFKGILGNDANADALTGQILGNFARGNKQAATEQLLYGMTGVASGPETIFAKYGFNSSQQGANFLGGMGAAQLTAPIAGMLGGNQPTYRGPNGQGTYGAGQYPMAQPATQQGAYYTGKDARGNDKSFVNPEMMRLAIDADKSARDSLPHIAEGTWKALDDAKTAAKLANEQYLTSKAGTDEYRIAQETREQAQARLTERTNQILESRPSAVGGGSSAGGNFMANMGNFAFDLGTSLVASKLTQGIKNPYLKAFANYGISSAANSFIAPMLFGTKAIAGGAAAAPGLFTASNAASLGSSLMPGSATGFAGTAGNILTNSGYTTAGSFMGGVQNGMNLANNAGGVAGVQGGNAFAAGEMVGEYLPYAASIVKLLKGDVKGAATTAAFTYIGGAVATAFGLPPQLGQAVGAIVGSFVGRKPKPAVLRVTGSSGNEVTATTTWSKDSPPEAWSKFADTILVALLNSAKLMQQQSGATLPFINIGIYVDSQSGISLFLYQEGEPTNTSALPKWSKNFGSIDNFKMGTAVVGMIEFMRDCLKEGKDAITADKLDKATAELKSKNIQTITSGVLNELKPGGQYDLTKGVGYDSGKPTTSGRTVGIATARNTTGTATNATVTAATKTTSATSLTSSSEQTTTMNNGAPVNSVVAVGGKTENDNSTTVTNINQMSPMNDPWRQPLYNTGFQLAA